MFSWTSKCMFSWHRPDRLDRVWADGSWKRNQVSPHTPHIRLLCVQNNLPDIHCNQQCVPQNRPMRSEDSLDLAAFSIDLSEVETDEKRCGSSMFISHLGMVITQNKMIL